MQRRQDKVRGIKMVEPVSEPNCEELIVIPSDIAQLQRQDPPLTPLFLKCVPSSTKVTERVREVFFPEG